MITSSLQLGDTTDDHFRQLALLPFNSKNHILAYGGEDGSVSLIENETTVKTARRFPETIRAVAISHDSKRVAVGFGDGSITIFVYNKLEGDVHPFLVALRTSDSVDDEDFFSQLDGMEEISDDEISFSGPRFQTPVRSLIFDPRNNNFLACGSEDSGFCIVDATSSETLSKKRFLTDQSAEEHNETGVRGLAYHQTEKQVFLASLDLQGRLCLWDVTGEDPAIDYELFHKDNHKSIHQVDQGIINDSEPADQASFPVFGKGFLGLPGSNDVQLRTFSEIEKQFFIHSMDGEKGHVEPIVSLCFSETGKILITAGRDGRICSWGLDCKKGNESKGHFLKVAAEMEDICTSILWVGKKVYLAFSNGTFSVIDAKEKLIPPKEAKSVTEVSNPDAEGTDRTKENQNISSDEEDIDFGDVKNSKPRTLFIDDEADDEGEDSNNARNKEKIHSENTSDLQTGSDADANSIAENEDFIESEYTTEGKSQYIENQERAQPQSAFAPSSTPLDLNRRIMCWNHIGAITSQRNDGTTTRNTIDITFTDAAFKRPVSFTDNMDFIVGSLGDDGAFFSTDVAQGKDEIDVIDEDIEKVVDGLNISDRTKAALQKSRRLRMKKDSKKPSGSSLYFHRFETFGNLNNKDWVVTLPNGELAVGSASGTGWSACITNRRFLRIYSSSGNQGPIVWLDGEPVTMVGRGRFLAVFYHAGAPLPDGTQKLAYSIYDGVSTENLSSGSLSCISSRSFLAWAGFSKEGSLMVMDSDGMLSMLVTIENTDNRTDSFKWDWSPVLDTVGLRKSIEDSYWPVTVQDGKLICVPLKGGNEHPDATRRPITTALNLRMPLAYGSDKNIKLEELSVRAKLALNQKKYMLSKTGTDGYDVDELEDEYRGLCAQVDKVTLKLFMANLELGKVERALDLTHKLHLEKSFDIAIHLAERTSHRTLTDRIETLKDRRFAVEEDDNISDDEQFNDEVDVLNPNSQASQPSINVIPDSSQKNPTTPVKKRLRGYTENDNDNDNDEQKKSRKNLNPFAKKRYESPARPGFSQTSQNKDTPTRIGISRLSSFSAKSRSLSKERKNIL